MPNYKLYYFTLRGRGEIIRLLFVAAGQDYEDVRITFEEWPKKKDTFVTGQLPSFEVDGQQFCQSLAIARYLAREFGYAGKSNIEQALVDQVVDTVNDYLGDFYKAWFAGEDKKETEVGKYVNESTPKTLKCIEKWLNDNNGGDGFFVGSSVTMADLLVYEALTNVIQIDSKVLDAFPKIAAHRKRVATLPKIKEYLEKRPKSDV